MSEKILFVFRGEGASGAEIVIERLIAYDKESIDAHVFIAPCPFGDALIAKNIASEVVVLDELKSLNRSQSSALGFYFKALRNYLHISMAVYRYAKKNEIKIIHANTIVPAIYLLPALLFSKIFARNMRWLWSDHDLTYYSSIDTKLSAICVSLYSKTLAVSEAVKNKYGKRDKIDVLYNGLDLNFFNKKSEL
ncbi:MAG: glycosyltransferase, partial [Pedobacter agri]